MQLLTTSLGAPSNTGTGRKMLRGTLGLRPSSSWGWGWAEGSASLILDDVNFDICLCACLLGVVDASLVAVTSNNFLKFCFLYKNFTTI